MAACLICFGSEGVLLLVLDFDLFDDIKTFAAVLLARGNVWLLVLQKGRNCNWFMARNKNGSVY